LDVAEYEFPKREPALSPCWLGKFISLNISKLLLEQCNGVLKKPINSPS
jgi:hypothetical protein